MITIHDHVHGRTYDVNTAQFYRQPFLNSNKFYYEIKFYYDNILKIVDFSDEYHGTHLNYVEIDGRRFHHAEMDQNYDLVAALVENKILLSKIEALP